jgi:hypothetical protein
VEILLWLVPPVVVTVVAMLWVGWVGRDRREVDRDEAVRRLGAALDKDAPVRRDAPPRPRERPSGVALRRTPRTPARTTEQPAERTQPGHSDPGAGEQRRAS